MSAMLDIFAPGSRIQRRNEQSLAGDPADLGYQDAKREVAAAVDKLYIHARKFYDGDPWQDGDGWVGPRPDAKNPKAGRVLLEIRNCLVSHPGVEEIVNRHRDGVVGREPMWDLVPKRALGKVVRQVPKMVPGPDGLSQVPDPSGAQEDDPSGALVDEGPSPEEQTRIDEAVAALNAWWDEHDVLAEIQMAIEDFCLGGRGVLRIFVPAGNLNDNNEIDAAPLEQSLDRVWVKYCAADQAVVINDPMTMRKIGFYVYEIADFATGKATRLAEIVYVNDSGQTVIRSTEESIRGNGFEVFQPESKFGVSETAIDLGGQITMFQIEGQRLITEPILANQKALNKSKTMRARNDDLGGFLERTVLNGQMPGEWKRDEVTGEDKFIPEPFYVGPGSTNWIQGAQTGVTEDGKPILATPQMLYRDPVDGTVFDSSELSTYRDMLSGARQLHALISGDATASGESRKQARDDFEKSLKKTKTRADRLIRGAIGVALKLAATFMGQPTRYDLLRVNADCRVDAGPLSSEDISSILETVVSDPPLRSVEDGMSQLGIEDTDAMLAKIADEKQTLNPIDTERAKLGLAADKLALGQLQQGDQGAGAGGGAA